LNLSLGMLVVLGMLFAQMLGHMEHHLHLLV